MKAFKNYIAKKLTPFILEYGDHDAIERETIGRASVAITMNGKGLIEGDVQSLAIIEEFKGEPFDIFWQKGIKYEFSVKTRGQKK